MRNRKSRSRTRIIVTRIELVRLHSGVIETGGSKSFLRDLDPKEIQTRRAFRIDAWVPVDFKEGIKQFAATHSVIQVPATIFTLQTPQSRSMEANAIPPTGDESQSDTQEIGDGQPTTTRRMNMHE